VLLPVNDRSWQGAAKDEEHAMSHNLNNAVAVSISTPSRLGSRTTMKFTRTQA
jgi:hypothetical protein